MRMKYVDEQGNVVQAFSSTLPGLIIIPPGFEVSDAVPMEQEEFDQHLTNIAKKNKNYKEIDLHAEIAALKADIKLLKGNKP